jgi:serine/threonine protein kinase/Tol biopolymer transport system component
MALETGSRVGPYEIVSRIGAGGMGEVWRARDTRLERTVAIKTLPVELASNAQFRLRFEREAKTISQLNHPNICTLHDVGENYLVMEYLEGETLSDRLLRGALPPDEVLRIGMQIAEGLDKAHRQGVVHRDLKPANIMLTKSGAKLLDFGLAKSTTINLSIDDATQHRPLTREGTILGTFQYMAPEQLEGAEADARTDIFALGAVLYEMATGRRAFDGKTKTSLIAAIVGSRPAPISELQPVAPAALEHVVDKCLEKDPDARWQSAHDIVTELEWISKAGSKVTVSPFKAAHRRRRETMAWSLAAVLAVVAVIGGRAWWRERSIESHDLRFVIAPAEATNFIDSFDILGLALSPDGRRLVFSANREDGRRALFLRSFSEIEPKLIPETDDAMYPFWSPDGKSIGFFADGKLKKISAAGGPAQIICDAASGRGASWGEEGTILFAPNVYSGIHKVSAAGGTPQVVTKINEKTEVTHRWPHWLPNGKDFLYIIRPKEGNARGPARLMLGTIGGGTPTELMDNATNTMYADGDIYFGREQRLMKQKLDLDAKALVGDAAVIENDRLSFWEAKNYVVFTVAPDRSAVWLPEDPPISDLHFVDRQGHLSGEVITRGALASGASISPDGKKVAFVRGDGGSAREDIWIHDLERKQESRFTFEPGNYFSLSWSRDGSRLVFGASTQSVGGVHLKPLRGSMKPQALVDNNFWKIPGNLSPDGRRVVYSQQSGDAAEDLWILDLSTKKSEMFLRTRFSEMSASFSPDGRWIVFQSDESGRFEVYVRPADGSPEQWQVSTSGGSGPVWRADGREILYSSADGRVMSAAVEGGEEFAIGTVAELFKSAGGRQELQDVSRDGQRLLVMSSAKTAASLFHARMRLPQR